MVVDNSEAIIYGVNSDITERKRTEEVNAEIRTFIELDKLRSELVSNVSHELRTPLGLIKGATTTLQRSDVTFPPALRRQFLTNIITEANRLDRLVTDLLDISQMEQRLITLNRRPADLSTLVQTQVSIVQHKFGIPQAAAHTLILHKPDNPIFAHIDAPRMEQVLRNLLENAIIYSPDGGNITITLRTVGTSAEIEITDSGIGIAPEEQPHVFERFFRSDHPLVQSIRGTGLGLAISSEIVQAHHGTIDVQSSLGNGSTFTIRIPLLTEADASPPTNLEYPNRQQPEPFPLHSLEAKPP